MTSRPESRSRIEGRAAGFYRYGGGDEPGEKLRGGGGHGQMVKGSDSTREALVFVYNADSGLFNAVADAAHKIFSPRTYQCNLCALTHSALGMRREWKQFLDGLGVPLEFLHADELRARYGAAAGAALPAIFRRRGGGLEEFVGADEINECRTGDELKQLIAGRLSS